MSSFGSDEADDEAEVVRELEPGRDVRVVVEPRDDDLVARAELASDSARQREVERRHVGAERDGLVVAAEEARGGLVRLLDQRLRADAGAVRARRRWRWTRGSTSRRRRSPSPAPACRPARRRTRARCEATRSARAQLSTSKAIVLTRRTLPKRVAGCAVRTCSYSPRMRMRPCPRASAMHAATARVTNRFALCASSRGGRAMPSVPSGEELRRYFEERLDERIEPEAA